MLLDINSTQINITCQQYNCSEFEFNEENASVVSGILWINNTNDLIESLLLSLSNAFYKFWRRRKILVHRII